MSTLRPECNDNPHKKPCLPDSMALRGVYKAVKKRRVLGYGKLRSSQGPCAMGCFWDDNPEFAVNAGVLEQVAAVNDSVPPTATRSERRRHVLRWLEWKLGINQ